MGEELFVTDQESSDRFSDTLYIDLDCMITDCDMQSRFLFRRKFLILHKNCSRKGEK